MMEIINLMSVMKSAMTLMQTPTTSTTDKFYTSRVAMRVLTGQYIALMEQIDARKEHGESTDGGAPDDKNGAVGLINKHCCPGNVTQQAANDATALVTYYYGDAPDVNIMGDTKLKFAYLPAHLHYIIFELLKNSMRATIEKHELSSSVLPAINVVIAEGEDEVAIKISDQGGGISRQGMDLIWSYTYTTAAPEVLAPDSGATTAPIAGFGHGLPLSRLYARFWGGDMNVKCMEGYGTDVFIHLGKLGKKAETLPY